MKLSIIMLFALLLTGCGGGGGSNTSTETGDVTGNSSGSTIGTITLSGSDTSFVGTQLDTGFIGSSLAAADQPDYIVIVDKSSTVTFEEPNLLLPMPADPNNGFGLVVIDDSADSGIKGISMSIFVSGVKYNYTCTIPASTFINCGADSIALDIANKTITFNNATVINADTNTILTMDGSLVWGDTDAVGGGGGGGGGDSDNEAATELEGTWRTTCLYDDYWDSYDTGSITFSGNTFSSSGVEYSDSACTVIEESYSSTGTFVIGSFVTTSSGLSAKEIDMTLLTMDGNNFTYTFYNIFRVDSARLYNGDNDGDYDGNSIDKRPIDLDFSYYYTKD